MYKLKQKPEDFIVKEIFELDIDSSGKFACFLMKKTSYNTIDAIKTIAKKLNCKLKQIGFTGTKDRNAITYQFISIPRRFKKRAELLKLKDIELTFQGFTKERISLGDHQGNNFEIIVRNADIEPRPIKFIENYFDEQRFSKNNVNVGFAILKRNFKKAAKLLDLPEQDPIKQLRTLPKKQLMFYIHAVQSFFWNEIVSEIVSESNCFRVDYSKGTFCFTNDIFYDESIPLLGFGTKFEYKQVEELYKKIMKKYSIYRRDFIINQIPELSSEGSERVIDVMIDNLVINKADKAHLIKFTLPKGSYATIVIKKLFKS